MSTQPQAKITHKVADRLKTREFDWSLRKIEQPKVTEKQRLAGEPPEIFARWKYSEFAWVSRFVRLSDVYRRLLDLLHVDPEDYDFELEGFHCYRHVHDPDRHCDVESVYLPVIRCGKYHPYASVKHRRRASQRTLDRLEFLKEECRKRRVKFDYVLKIDLTLPKQISELWDSEQTNRCIHKAVRAFMSELRAVLFPKHKHSQLGAPSNHHYNSTENPLEPHRNIHLAVPNVTYNKKTGMFHRFRPFIEEYKIKKVWKKCLKENGLWPDVPDHVKCDVHIRYIKFEDRNRVIHRLSYCSRKPIEDLVENLEYSDLEDFDEEFALFLLDYTPRVVNLGFLTNLKRFGYSRKRISLKCPICGGDMMVLRNKDGEIVQFDRPPPGIPTLHKNRGGKWEKLVGDGSDFGNNVLPERSL